MKTATAIVRWYNTKHREGMFGCFQEKYYNEIVIAAPNSSVCEEPTD